MTSSKTSNQKPSLLSNLKEDMMAPESSFFIEGAPHFSSNDKDVASSNGEGQSDVLKILVVFLILMMVVFLLVV